ncbi:hypothetical protein JAAARDRAFT_86162, partial [Jaapia argillacea MUCL 33604]
LQTMELKMGIGIRWEPSSPEYKKTVEYMSKRKYHQALHHLQKLVIQRLFELHWLNLAQTAYRMRSHIAKSLQARCKAIRNVVTSYNEAAAALNPPRPHLDWSQVSHYQFLDEFNLLRDTELNVRQRRWAEPAVRAMMKQSLQIKRAHEELLRCNIEIRRLHT